MTYIELANRYWNAHRREAMPLAATHVFFWLLDSFSDARDRSDKNGRLPDSIRRTDGAVAGGANMSINAMKKARTKLESRGLLWVKLPVAGSNSGVVYRLTSSKNDEVNDGVRDEVENTTSSECDEVSSQPNHEPNHQPNHEPNQKVMSSIYSIPEPEPETDLNINYLSQSARPEFLDESEILEVEAEEVEPNPDDDGSANPPPSSGAPPPAEDDESELTERLSELLADRRLTEGLYRQHRLSREVIADWIEKYVLRQWTISHLKNRMYSDLRSHCESWINKQLENEHERNNQRNQPRAGGNRRGTGQSRAETGGELDDLARDYFGYQN